MSSDLATCVTSVRLVCQQHWCSTYDAHWWQHTGRPGAMLAIQSLSVCRRTCTQLPAISPNDQTALMLCVSSSDLCLSHTQASSASNSVPGPALHCRLKLPLAASHEPPRRRVQGRDRQGESNETKQAYGQLSTGHLHRPASTDPSWHPCQVLCAAGAAYVALSFAQRRPAVPDQQHERQTPLDVLTALDREARASTGTYWGLAPPPAPPQQQPKAP